MKAIRSAAVERSPPAPARASKCQCDTERPNREWPAASRPPSMSVPVSSRPSGSQMRRLDELAIGAAGPPCEHEAEQPGAVVRIAPLGAGLAARPRPDDRPLELVRADSPVGVAAVAGQAGPDQSAREPRQARRVRGEILEGDRPAANRDQGSVRQVRLGWVAERHQPGARHVDQQRGREDLGDRADLEHGAARRRAGRPTPRRGSPGRPMRRRPFRPLCSARGQARGRRVRRDWAHGHHAPIGGAWNT